MRVGRKLLSRAFVTATGFAAGAGLCAGCGGAARPAAETPRVTQLEVRIAAFAHDHPAVAGVGPDVRCAIRVLGRVKDSAYVEALCSSTSRAGSSTDLRCVPRDGSAVDTAAVATLDSTEVPVALRLDEQDDDGYRTWLSDNFPSVWQRYEQSGPRFGGTLESRLTASYGCGR